MGDLLFKNTHDTKIILIRGEAIKQHTFGLLHKEAIRMTFGLGTQQQERYLQKQLLMQGQEKPKNSP